MDGKDTKVDGYVSKVDGHEVISMSKKVIYIILPRNARGSALVELSRMICLYTTIHVKIARYGITKCAKNELKWALFEKVIKFPFLGISNSLTMNMRG